MKVHGHSNKLKERSLHKSSSWLKARKEGMTSCRREFPHSMGQACSLAYKSGLRWSASRQRDIRRTEGETVKPRLSL